DLEIREDDRRGEPEESVLLKERSEPPEPPERKELVERRAPERRDRPGGRDRHGRHDGRHERSGRGENFGPHAGGQRLRPFTNDVRHHNPHEKAPKREILVNCSPEESRVAVVEDDKLIELLIERSESEKIVGNIYKGRVENVLPGISSAFANIGLEKNAYLYVSDVIATGGRHPSSQIEKM